MMTPTVSADSQPSGPQPMTDATVSAEVAYLFSLGAFLVPFVIFAGLYVLLWGWLGTFIGSPLMFGLCVFMAMPIHEALHGLGFHLGGAKRTDVRYGIFWSKLMPYAHCKVPLSTRSLRVAVALPAVVLGLLPALAGLAFEQGTWVLFGVAQIGFSGGDIAALWAIRHVPGETWAIDHPTEVGCNILDTPKSVPGIR